MSHVERHASGRRLTPPRRSLVTRWRDRARLQRSRREAIEILRSASSIFIAYSHSDLRSVRALRRRLLRLRAGQDEKTVFLDQESLSAGSAVSPTVIDAWIRECALFVLVCGESTAQSVEVRRELDMALARRDPSPLILPIILNAGVVLPEGVDYQIQGIFLETLYPSILWWRVAAVTAIAILVGTSGLFIWRADHNERALRAEARLRSEAALRSSIELDRLGLRVPTDLARRERLAEMARRASRLGMLAEAASLRRELRRLPASDAREWIIGADARRKDLASAVNSSRLLLGYEDYVEVLDSERGRVVGTVDLRAVTAELPGRLSDLWEQAVSSQEVRVMTARRAPARLVHLQGDPSRDGTVVLEVSYEDFGLLSMARQVTRRGRERSYDGEPFYSNAPRETSEQELLLLDLDSLAIRSAGLSRQLEWAIQSNMQHEENGRSWYEARDGEPELVPSWINEEVARLEGVASVVRKRLLAVDPHAGAALVEVQKHDPAWDEAWEGVAEWLEIYVLLVRRNGANRRVTAITSYLPGARYRYSEDGPNDPFTDVMPNHAPAALSMGRALACLRERCRGLDRAASAQARTLDLPWGLVEAVRFTRDGSALVVELSDRSVGLYDLASGAMQHRFPAAPHARRLVVDPSGERVIVLFDTGQVEAWRLRAFGPDGWAP